MMQRYCTMMTLSFISIHDCHKNKNKLLLLTTIFYFELKAMLLTKISLSKKTSCNELLVT
jgi:hypothetical protein